MAHAGEEGAFGPIGRLGRYPRLILPLQQAKLFDNARHLPRHCLAQLNIGPAKRLVGVYPHHRNNAHHLPAHNEGNEQELGDGQCLKIVGKMAEFGRIGRANDERGAGMQHLAHGRDAGQLGEGAIVRQIQPRHDDNFGALLIKKGYKAEISPQ